jgi:hypothetical protein
MNGLGAGGFVVVQIADKKNLNSLSHIQILLSVT